MLTVCTSKVLKTIKFGGPGDGQGQGHLLLVFAGSVDGTEKKTETDTNATEKDQTSSCGCINPETFRLPVTRFDVVCKDRQKPVHTGYNWSFT
jgi:hypothetical protein